MMNPSNGKDNNTSNPTTTIENTGNDVSQAELNLRMEKNRVEAQRRRNESQREAANTLQTLVLQQQEQIQKLQQHAHYEQLRQDIAGRASLPSNMASSNTPNNLKFDGSSVYVTTFNPPAHDDMKLGVTHIHEAEKTATDLFTLTITPNSDRNFSGADAFIALPPKNDPNMLQAALLSDLDAEPNTPPHKSAVSNSPTRNVEKGTDSQPTYNAIAHSPEIIDLTNECPESSYESPKKRGKTTTVEVTIIVKMPGLVQPFVKTVESTVESTGSNDDSVD
jgi:hypothetical protein